MAEVLFPLCTYVKELYILPIWPLKGTQIISAIQLCYLKYPQSPITEDFNWSLWTTRRWQRVKFKSTVSQVERKLNILIYTCFRITQEFTKVNCLCLCSTMVLEGSCQKVPLGDPKDSGQWRKTVEPYIAETECWRDGTVWC